MRHVKTVLNVGGKEFCDCLSFFLSCNQKRTEHFSKYEAEVNKTSPSMKNYRNDIKSRHSQTGNRTGAFTFQFKSKRVCVGTRLLDLRVTRICASMAGAKTAKRA